MADITFFPVGNGGMSLIRLSDGNKTSILIDVNIRTAADDNEEGTCDVTKELRKKIRKDDNERPYVDVFLLTHPDKDHCTGLTKHFHLGSLDEYDDESGDGEDLKIIIKELWSSPMIFRRASKNNALCADAKEFNKEAKRRVKQFEESKDGKLEEGDRVKILGEDVDGKTDKLEEILVKVDEVFQKVNGQENEHIEMCLIGPLSKQEDEERENVLNSNRSSVIIQFSVAADKNNKNSCLFLTCGDAKVTIWEYLWDIHKNNPKSLEYDLLQVPHHCSWHSLSHDSWAENHDPKVSSDAKNALSQALNGAIIVSSSDSIKDDDNDPPCIGAKREYESISEEAGGSFYCTEEYPDEEKPMPLEFKITKEGPQPPAKKSRSRLEIAGIATASRPQLHG